MYGKLVNGVLECAPFNFTSSNGEVSNMSDEKLKELGYKEIEEAVIEYDPVDEYLVPSYSETEYKIIVTYTSELIDITEFKKEKIEQSKLNLAEYLKNNPLYSNCHNGEHDYYSVTAEKQNLLTSAYTSYTILKAAGQDPILTWNATGKPCEEWQETEFIQLISEIQAYVYPLIRKQQLMEVAITKATKMSELEEVNINFE